MLATIATMTSKHQITIPKELREDLKMQAGDRLVFSKKNGVWRLRPVPSSASEFLSGLGRGLKGDYEELHKEFEEGWEDR